MVILNGNGIVVDVNSPNVRAIAHRGYSANAPENTLSAYRLAKEKGFTYVECDVSVTADGVPVLLHDTTVDRTSNGTGNITSLTFEAVRTLDFGGWFSAEFAGEKIPSLEEFIIFCKWNGLHPYIEIKSNVTTAQIPTLVSVVRRYDMLRKVSWISSSSSLLNAVKAQDAKARLGYVVSTASTDSITWATSAKTDSNEVFVDVLYTQVTETFASDCADAGIPLEVWTVNSADDMAALDPYVSGFTSDNVRANVALYGKFNVKTSDTEIVRVITQNELMKLTSLQSTSPYYQSRNHRWCYAGFDIPVESGYVYKFNVDTDATDLHIGLQAYTAAALEGVPNGASVETGLYDPGWKKNGVEITFPASAVGVRMVFKQDAADTQITDDNFIRSVTITRKAD